MCSHYRRGIQNESFRTLTDCRGAVYGRLCGFHLQGLSVRKLQVKHALTAGLYFGGFQALMPLIGYFFLGTQFQSLITDIDHWIAFVLLALIGFNMVRESFGESERLDASFRF